MKSVTPKIAQLIAADIRMKIVRHELKQGDHLPLEASLMEEYDVSRPTIREALRILENESLLLIRPGGRFGAVVQAPNVEVSAHLVATLLQFNSVTVADVWTAWSSIECMAMRILCDKRERTDISSLRTLAAQFEDVVDSPELHADLGLAFSEELLRLSGSQTLLVLFHLLRNIIVAEIRAVRRKTDPQEVRWLREGQTSFFASILDLIERGDPKAVVLWEERLEEVGGAVLGLIGADSIVDVLTLEAKLMPR